MSTVSNLKVPFQFSSNFSTSCQPQTGKVIISLKECWTINNIKRISANVTKYFISLIGPKLQLGIFNVISYFGVFLFMFINLVLITKMWYSTLFIVVNYFFLYEFRPIGSYNENSKYEVRSSQNRSHH